jgi:hypothetical protein
MISRLGVRHSGVVRARFVSFLQTWDASTAEAANWFSPVVFLEPGGSAKTDHRNAHGGRISPARLRHAISRCWLLSSLAAPYLKTAIRVSSFQA